MAINNNDKINISGTLGRFLAYEDGAKIVDGKEVEGGYFVCETLPSWGTVGQLCYCTGDSKFHQYDGTDWVEAKLGGTDDLIASSKTGVKINGDLEVTGDLSFGADSHLVFGTIEGSDFIADHIEAQSIKINGKRVLTEDDLVNLVAYPAAEDYTF